ncbi:hypothetical protein GQ600_4327 [Phytophthora cactorum]|nr:hypothetical protein GQ600_4327 [Phytophthora cactorum]
MASNSMRFLEAFTRAAKRQHVSGRAQRGLFAGRDKRSATTCRSPSAARAARGSEPPVEDSVLRGAGREGGAQRDDPHAALRGQDGGLDNYLLSIKDERELGVKGLKARDRVLAALAEA